MIFFLCSPLWRIFKRFVFFVDKSVFSTKKRSYRRSRDSGDIGKSVLNPSLNQKLEEVLCFF